MDTQPLSSPKHYIPILILAGKAAGWALLLPALAVYWLFMLLFKLAGATLNWAANSEKSDVDASECNDDEWNESNHNDDSWWIDYDRRNRWG